MNLDNVTQEILSTNKNMHVPYYLMAAYAYYEEDDPILSDHLFDSMAKAMLYYWDDIEHHHKHLLNKDDLNAGSYLGTYPERVKGGLEALRSKYYVKPKRKVKAKKVKSVPAEASLENFFG